MAILRDLSSGKLISFEKIPYKETNLVKIALCSEDFIVEEVYVVVSDTVYGNISLKISEGTFPARLAVNAKVLPFKSWGLHIICRYNGVMPYANIGWINYMSPSQRVFSHRVETSLSRRIFNFFINLFY